MSKKLTIEFVEGKFEDGAYECLSNEYINAHSKLKYRCPEGHYGSIRWSNWQQGQRCSTCSGRKKLTISFIRLEFEKEGWTCVSTEYINSWIKLDYICPEGHYGSITWDNWKQGIRCPVCSGKKKHTIEFVKSEFEKEGWICTSTEYINVHSKLNYICSKGHKGEITWGHWQQGGRCPICVVIKSSGSGHYNWKGGISKEPYCPDWTKDLKGFVKARDDYKCLNPYCISKAPDDLTVHHIDYNKKSCGPENLITICRSCNAKANKDREWHQLWYEAILNRRYNKTKTLKSVKRRYKIF